MGIRFDEGNRIFELDTENTSYRIGIADDEGFVGHIYYGKKIRSQKCGQFLRTWEGPLVPSVNDRERCSFLDLSRRSIPAMESETTGRAA